MLRLIRSAATAEVQRPARAFLGVATLLFAVSAAATVAWCTSMPAMDGMPMPGGWTLSMAWMRMPGQTWPGAAASFLGMWMAMMAAMMMPSLTSMLWRYRQAVAGTGTARSGWLTAQVGLAYFLMWTLLGLAVFFAGVVLAGASMQRPALAHAIPFLAAATVLVAGLVQFSAWKARRLACCRMTPGHGRAARADAGTAWRHGVRLGFECIRCCANHTAVLLVVGVMDLRAMAFVSAAITAERLAPAGERVAQTVGVLLVGAGLVCAAQACRLA